MSAFRAGSRLERAGGIRLALNADTTPLAVSDTLVFKSFEDRAREAAAAGFDAVNADRSEEGLTPRKVKEVLERHHLQVASGFFQGPLYDPAREAEILEEARRQLEFSEAVGQNVLFVSAHVSPAERHAWAGRIRPGVGPALSGGQFACMARLLEKIGGTWKQRGVRLCFHPHAATYVEAPHEIERLMEATDPERVWLGPDTGHLLLGGADPVEIVRRYFDRLGALHVKDVDAAVLERVRAEGLDYRQACAAGIWTELGHGCVDFPRLFRYLRKRHWSGWVIVETDHTRYDTALESSRDSRRYLREVIGV